MEILESDVEDFQKTVKIVKEKLCRAQPLIEEEKEEIKGSQHDGEMSIEGIDLIEENIIYNDSEVSAFTKLVNSAAY